MEYFKLRIPCMANAITKINPNAKFNINGDDAYENIEWLEGTTPISQNDIETKLAEMTTAWENEKQTEETNKANGNQKLLDLGLTQAEATALTGYTPPVAE